VLNIDLSFFKSSEFESDKHDLLELDSNKNLQHQIVEQLLFKVCNCEGCNQDVILRDSDDNRNIIEAHCKGILGEHFCDIPKDLQIELHKNDKVIIQIDDVFEISEVRETGEIVKYKRDRMNLFNEELPVVARIATEKDIEQFVQNCADEESSKNIFRKCVDKYELNMKLVNVHFQFDRKKLYFFYTSDSRVDFRELAKELASIFKTRIELRQIGVRDEAKKVGGLGTCGREYCCSAFLDNFKKITTQIASEQNCAGNINKLSGPCGKLKCCLSFEIE